MPYYATNLILQQAFRTARQLGVPRTEMLDYLGIDEKTLLRPGGMVPTPIILDAIEYGAKRSGHADFGFRMAAAMPEGIFAGLAILLSHCRTIGEAADAIREQFHVVNSAVAIEIVREDAGRTITFHLLCQGRHEPVQHSEMQLKMVLQLVSFLAGRAWTPKHVQLPFDRQSPLGRYEQEFGCPVAFGHGRTTFILGKEDADLPLEIDHTKLQKMVMRAFDSLAGRAPRSALEFPDEVARIVRGQLSRGHVSTSAVAGAMNLSTRSLQRRLFAHGVTLKSIIDAEKARLANPKPPEPSASTKKA
jgi:archaellum component FlaG (FlaF/FlaG flagellin family)